MKRQLWTGFVAVMILGSLSLTTCQAKPKTKTSAPSAVLVNQRAAKKAALAWLTLLDTGKFTQSWDTASESIQARVDRAHWPQIIQNVRKPLGNMQTRSEDMSSPQKSLPHAPPGEYFLVQYTTRFTQRQAVESVSLLHESDKNWKVCGYRIRPE
jgi:hypothetical protein